MITFEVPNLDDQWAVDLLNVSKVLHALGSYTELRAQAMWYREGGQVEHAATLEASADDLYENLPQWAKW